MKTLLVTGYRAHELGIYDAKHQALPYIKKALEQRLVPLIEEGVEWVITAGQYGVDLWACEVVIGLKRRYPELKLGIITAYASPEEKWKEEKKAEYSRIVAAADYYGAVSKAPYEGVWQLRARDDLLLRKSDGILLFYDEEAADSSAKFMKERAEKLSQDGDYELHVMYAEEIQNIADEENRSSFEM